MLAVAAYCSIVTGATGRDWIDVGADDVRLEQVASLAVVTLASRRDDHDRRAVNFAWTLEDNHENLRCFNGYILDFRCKQVQELDHNPRRC